MQSAREKIIENLQSSVKNTAGEKIDVNLDIPQDPAHGDYATNIALVLSKKLGKNPREIADNLKEECEKLGDSNIEKVEVAGPGFLNFYLSKNYLTSNLKTILDENEEYGNSNTLKDKKLMVEFTDPNPLKEFHIGHLYSNTVGESLSRLFESQGAELWRVNYQGDIGLHVAKALWGIQKKMVIDGVDLDSLEKESLEMRAKFLGEAYALGAQKFEEDEEVKKDITAFNKKVYDKDPGIYPLYEKARLWSLDYFETIYARLGTKFNRYYFESEAGPIGLEIVKKHLGDIFQEEGGAVIFPKEKSGLHTRVFINSLGLPTYEAKELGLAPTKYNDFPYDTSVIITGNEINEYFKVLLKALSFIKPDLADKTKHLSHGMVRLPSGKMSSRTGDVITGEWLLDETKKKLSQAYPEMTGEVSEVLSVGAVKYALLKSTIGQDITFSFDESINLHGNSGPYIQYTHARTQSVLSRAGVLDLKLDPLIHIEREEAELLRRLVHFPEVVKEAAVKYAPNYVSTYLFELSQLFNLFYEKHRITNAENEEVRNFRVQLTAGVGQVLRQGLYLLGIKAPDKI